VQPGGETGREGWREGWREGGEGRGGEGREISGASNSSSGGGSRMGMGTYTVFPQLELHCIKPLSDAHLQLHGGTAS
jgi:hypothetical protein